MSNRRMDAAYFIAFVAIVGLAWWGSNRPEAETGPISVPDFSLPGIELEVPFELPNVFMRFARPPSPRLDLGKDTESVIVEVREALLTSSAREEADVDIEPSALPAERLAVRLE